eukprot:CAMPEP_0113502736 /NCGR_PEP_ID=MMETSP0014_2-20120614/33743_1 /TAXON_ID=2857 /ORGANISM="Nitzschia sp." /LENGTH=51 /DNA_ID=CAMNT_0000397603 /DNA_START=122 /DNA_END=277 /DNA_ORIENTATION=- /assembly_acc=CAM_ASM_000159
MMVRHGIDFLGSIVSFFIAQCELRWETMVTVKVQRGVFMVVKGSLDYTNKK